MSKWPKWLRIVVYIALVIGGVRLTKEAIFQLRLKHDTEKIFGRGSPTPKPPRPEPTDPCKDVDRSSPNWEDLPCNPDYKPPYNPSGTTPTDSTSSNPAPTIQDGAAPQPPIAPPVNNLTESPSSPADLTGSRWHMYLQAPTGQVLDGGYMTVQEGKLGQQVRIYVPPGGGYMEGWLEGSYMGKHLELKGTGGEGGISVDLNEDSDQMTGILYFTDTEPGVPPQLQFSAERVN